MRVTPHVSGLAAGIPVAVDDEAPQVEFFEVDVPRGDGPAREGGGGETDGFRLVHGGRGGLGVYEPDVELGEGGRGELGAGEGAFGVLVGAGGGGLGAGGGD